MDMTSSNSMMALSSPPTKRRRLSSATDEQQQRGFLEPLLFYLKKNANPRLLLKLMQISKYFMFKEFPFLVIADLKFDKNQWLYCKKRHSFEYKTLDLENLTKPIWITNAINCYTEDSKLISRLLPKIAVCDIVNLRLEDQIVTLDEFKTLTSFGRINNVTLCYSHVEDENGEVVPVEKIIELLPMVQGFRWLLDPEAVSTFTSETAKNIANFLNPSIMSSFCIMNIPESFDFETFANFMDANPSIDFFLDFDVLIPREYSMILQTYIDKIIENGFEKYQPLQLRFPRQTDACLNAMQNLYKIYGQQKLN